MAKAKAADSGLNLRNMSPYFIGVGILILLDQATKLLLAQSLALHTGKVILPGFFNLVHVHNTGGAFSIFASAGSSWRRWVFVALAFVVVGIITYAYSKVNKADWWTRVSYTLIAGGAIGNVIDRIRMGEVIDFLDFYVGTWHWPAFNVADIAVSTGAVMLFLSLLRGK